MEISLLHPGHQEAEVWDSRAVLPIGVETQDRYQRLQNPDVKIVERDMTENVGTWIGNRLLPRNLSVLIVRRDMMVNADIL